MSEDEDHDCFHEHEHTPRAQTHTLCTFSHILPQISDQRLVFIRAYSEHSELLASLMMSEIKWLSAKLLAMFSNLGRFISPVFWCAVIYSSSISRVSPPSSPVQSLSLCLSSFFPIRVKTLMALHRAEDAAWMLSSKTSFSEWQQRSRKLQTDAVWCLSWGTKLAFFPLNP